MGKTYDYSPVHRALEIIAILAFAGVAIALGWRVYHSVTDTTGWIIVAATALGGYVAADLVSGIVHWLADTYGTPDTPLAGPNLVRPFREHHRWPEDIAHHDFVETNGNNCIVSVPAMIIFLFVPTGHWVGLAAVNFMLFLTLAVFGTNQFHKWAHTREPSAVIRFLQKTRLILGKEHHEKHHTVPFDTYYCITTGWLNWTLAKTRFWRVMEWTILKVLGYKARDYTDSPAELGAKPKGVKLAADGSVIHEDGTPIDEAPVEQPQQQPSAA